MLKILFLDIDGVLNNENSGTRWLCGPEHYGIDPNNVSILKKIITATDCKIVWITSWRKHPDDFVWNFNKYVRFTNPFPAIREELKEYTYTKFPLAPHRDKGDKSDDISLWTRENRSDIVKLGCRFAILDDQGDENLDFYADSFFRTSTKTGLTVEIANRVIAHLNWKEK